MLGTKHTIQHLKEEIWQYQSKAHNPGTVLSISEQGLPNKRRKTRKHIFDNQADIPVSKTEWVETLTRIKNEIN